jgi:hypothetical protein
MKTDDLLKQAPARPWRSIQWSESISIDAPDCAGVAFVNPMGARGHGIPSRADRAKAELITRAVNSFEAMREALKNISREGWKNGLGQDVACLGCHTAGRHGSGCLVRAALDLAEGESEMAPEKRKSDPVSPKLATLLSAAGDVIENRDCTCSTGYRCSVCELSNALAAFSESEVQS